MMNDDENKKSIIKQEIFDLNALEERKKLAQKLMQTPHYAKMGAEGILAVIETAKSIGMDPIRALNGGLYGVKGRVEMSSRMMSSLIRAKGHSITKDKDSNDTICILNGKRADNGDCWKASFSIEEAQRAGLVKPASAWITYPTDMLFARALSRLARQLFSDIIGDCFIEGEIRDDDSIPDPTKPKEIIKEKPLESLDTNPIDKDQGDKIVDLLKQHEGLKDDFFQHFGIQKLSDIKKCDFDKAVNWILVTKIDDVIEEKEEVKEKGPYDE